MQCAGEASSLNRPINASCAAVQICPPTWLSMLLIWHYGINVKHDS
jgi:hypothetical protein